MDPNDSGLASRKLWFSVGTSIAIMLGGVFYAFVPGFREGFDPTIFGLLSVLGVYSGANIGHRYLSGKLANRLSGESTDEPADPKDQ